MATKWSRTPGMTDDVVKSSTEDIEKVRKARNLDSSKLRGGAREAVREAGSRAGSRLTGRAGLAGTAIGGGYALGRGIDEKTGLGKTMVEKSGLGSFIDRMVGKRDKVELSQDAKSRLSDMDTDRVMREVDADIEASKYAKKDKATEYKGDDVYKKGGSVRGWGMARGARKAKIV